MRWARDDIFAKAFDTAKWHFIFPRRHHHSLPFIAKTRAASAGAYKATNAALGLLAMMRLSPALVIATATTAAERLAARHSARDDDESATC